MSKPSNIAGPILAAIVLVAVPAAARDLVIGLSAPPTSFDPHYHAHAPSIAAQAHVYQPLVQRRADLSLGPVIAREWVPLPDGNGWEFRLDPAARFSDGAPVTAADVAASLARVPTIPNSPGRWTPFITEITGTEIVDARTIRIRTNGPAPLIPNNLFSILIIPERFAREAATSDFNAGRAAIGSGPFRLRAYVQGERVEFDRNDQWWMRSRAVEPAPEIPWTRVSARIIANDSARVAALRAGDVQLIEQVPPRDTATLAANPALSVVRANSVRMVYISVDMGRDASPGITDNEGRPLARNPLKDVRVRRALSLAIDRAGMVDRVMEGQAVATAQMLPIGMGGTDPDLRPTAQDLAAARRLLAEAGWAEGFRIQLAGPNDRIVNDERILQAVAQMWERIGVRTRVDAMPSSVFFGRFSSNAFSAALNSWGNATGEPNTYFASMIATQDRSRGRGTVNVGGYSNPRVDALIERAHATIERDARHAAWREAARISLGEEFAILPLHHQVNVWASRRGLVYEARPDELTFAMSLRVAE